MAHAAGGETSLNCVLNRKTLYVKDVPDTLTRAEIRAELEKVCPSSLGRIVVPVRRRRRPRGGHRARQRRPPGGRAARRRRSARRAAPR